MERKYKVGKTEDGYPTITLPCSLKEIPFGVWRDLGRIAGRSISLVNKEIFIFLVPDNLSKGEKVLKGALWEKEPKMSIELNDEQKQAIIQLIEEKLLILVIDSVNIPNDPSTIENQIESLCSVANTIDSSFTRGSFMDCNFPNFHR